MLVTLASKLGCPILISECSWHATSGYLLFHISYTEHLSNPILWHTYAF